MQEKDIDKLFCEYKHAVDIAHAKEIAQKVLKIIDDKLILEPENYNLYLKKIHILDHLNRDSQGRKTARKVIKLCEQKLKFDKNNIKFLKIQLQMYGKLIDMYTRRDKNELVFLYIKKRSIIKKILKINPSDKSGYELDFINSELQEYFIAYGIIIVLIIFFIIAYQRYKITYLMGAI